MSLARLLPPFIAIPAVPFRMGTPERDLSALAKSYGGTRESYREEAPQHTLTLPAFAIAHVPVTVALYAEFVLATGARAPVNWHGPRPPAALLDHPVVDVSWDEANAFCAWLTTATTDHPFAAAQGRRPPTTDPNDKVTRRQDDKVMDISEPTHPLTRSPVHPLTAVVGRQSSLVYRLPTEAEWEHAARGEDGRVFPWGDSWEAARANTRDSGPGGTTPVGSYPGGVSPYGCLDMAGNIWEWTASLDALYPYRPSDGREEPRATGRRILRGGCYANPQGFARCACRFRLPPAVRNEFLGVRLARVS